MAHGFPDIIAFCLLLPVLVTAAVFDVRRGTVPNKLTYPAMLVGLVYWTIAGLIAHHGAQGLVQSSLGLAAGLVPFALLFMLGGLGGGDVKLMGAVGAIGAAWQIVLATTVYALIVAVVFAIVLMFRHGIVKRTATRLLGAALLAGAKTKPEFPPDSPRVPFALAIALGGALAGMEQLLGLWTPWAHLNP